MKQIFVLFFVLVIGLIVIGGCAPSTVELSDQQENQIETAIEPQQAGNDEIPTPPALPEE